MSIYIKNVIIGESYEQCLKDFIKSLQWNGEEIHCLSREVVGPTYEDPIDVYITYLNTSPCKYLVNNLKDSEVIKYIKDVKDNFDQEYLDDWCKMYSFKNDHVHIHRQIYTINRNDGSISQYYLNKIFTYSSYNINEYVSQGDVIGLYIGKNSI